MTAHGNIEPLGAFLCEKRGPFLTILVVVLCVIYTPNYFLSTIIEFLLIEHLHSTGH